MKPVNLPPPYGYEQPVRPYAPYGYSNSQQQPSPTLPYVNNVNVYPPTNYQNYAEYNPPANYNIYTSDLESGTSPDYKLITEDLPIAVRHAFIRKVYSILSLQLGVTFALALTLGYVDVLSNYLVKNAWLVIVASIATFVIVIVLSCFPNIARKHPWGILGLVGLSGSMGVLLGYSALRVDLTTFAMAMGVTFAVVVALTLFAFQTKYDFTGFGPYLLVGLLVLMLIGIVGIFVRNQVLHTVYAAIGVLLFSMMLVYDTQLVVGGKHHKIEFSLDDYVLATLSLYLDIVNLFMYILSLISDTRN